MGFCPGLMLVGMADMAGFFITGTDTGVGKTRVTVALMGFLRTQGLSVLGMKPVASGCFFHDGQLRNEDAMLLQENATWQIDYAKLNIYAFEPPIAPHLAARQSGQSIELERIVRQCRELERQADCVVVEGVGGWEVPLNTAERVSHLAKALKLPVILVVGMRLGCLSHAILTHDAMLRSGVECAGWIANCVEADFPFLDQNIESLRSELAFPFLGALPHFGCRNCEVFPKSSPERELFALGREEILRRLGI